MNKKTIYEFIYENLTLSEKETLRLQMNLGPTKFARLISGTDRWTPEQILMLAKISDTEPGEIIQSVIGMDSITIREAEEMQKSYQSSLTPSRK